MPTTAFLVMVLLFLAFCLAAGSSTFGTWEAHLRYGAEGSPENCSLQYATWTKDYCECEVGRSDNFACTYDCHCDGVYYCKSSTCRTCATLLRFWLARTDKTTTPPSFIRGDRAVGRSNRRHRLWCAVVVSCSVLVLLFLLEKTECHSRVHTSGDVKHEAVTLYFWESRECLILLTGALCHQVPPTLRGALIFRVPRRIFSFFFSPPGVRLQEVDGSANSLRDMCFCWIVALLVSS